MNTYYRGFNDRRYHDNPPPPRKYGRVRSYRGIPESVDKDLKRVADAINVPVGDVVRALLEYGLAAHQRGEIAFSPTAQAIRSRRRNTLFPPKP
jgi:hypothetical protein